MLRCEGIEFKYDDGPVFSFPNFSCETGDQMLLLGQSGSGKTTLLHLLAGMLQPTNGSIVIDGTAVDNLTPSKLDHFRGKNIGRGLRSTRQVINNTFGRCRIGETTFNLGRD